MRKSSLLFKQQLEKRIGIMFKNFESERISPTVKLSNSESPSKISRKSPCIMLFEKACSCCLKSLIWAPNTAFVFAQCSAQGHLSACPATNFLFLCRGAGGGGIKQGQVLREGGALLPPQPSSQLEPRLPYHPGQPELGQLGVTIMT